MTTRTKIWASIIGGLALTVGGFALYFRNKSQAPDKQDESTPSNTGSNGTSTGTSSGSVKNNTIPTPVKSGSTSSEVHNPVSTPAPLIAPTLKLNEIVYANAPTVGVYSAPEITEDYIMGTIPKYQAIGLYKGLATANKTMAVIQIGYPEKLKGNHYVRLSQITNIKS